MSNFIDRLVVMLDPDVRFKYDPESATLSVTRTDRPSAHWWSVDVREKDLAAYIAGLDRDFAEVPDLDGYSAFLIDVWEDVLTRRDPFRGLRHFVAKRKHQTR